MKLSISTAMGLVCVLAACGQTASTGGSGQGSAADPCPTDTNALYTQCGTFAAMPLDAVSGAAYLMTPADADAGIASRLVVAIGDAANVCTTGPVHVGGTLVSLDLLSGDATFQPGTFSVLSKDVPSNADVSITKFDAACDGASKAYGAASGTVVIESVSTTSISGSFDVVLEAGAGTFRGHFTAPVCAQDFTATCAP